MYKCGNTQQHNGGPVHAPATLAPGGVSQVGCVLIVMAHAQKPDFVFWRNGRVHLNRRGRQFSQILANRGVRISGSNAGYTMFRGSVKNTGYPPNSPVSPSLPLPCVTVFHHISTGVYILNRRWWWALQPVRIRENLLVLREIEWHSSVLQPGDQSLHQLTRLIPYVYEIIGIFGVEFDVKYQREGLIRRSISNTSDYTMYHWLFLWVYTNNAILSKI